jgi:small subunit ribosomal protein S3Ae
MVKGVGSKIKWKRKKWFNILAPALFGEQLVGQTPATDGSRVKGKNVRVNASEILNDPRKQDRVLTLKVSGVAGSKASTIIKSYSTNKPQLRKIIRKGGSRVDINNHYETKDGKKVNVKTLLFTASKCQANKRKELRAKADAAVEKMVGNKSYEELVMEVIMSKFQVQLKIKMEKVHPIRFTEIISFTNLSV